MMQRETNIRFNIYILSLYILILPIDAALGNIIGSTSLINYILILYIAFKILTIVISGKLKVNAIKKCRMPIIYFLYFMFSTIWANNNYINNWQIFSLIGCFFMFIFSALDNYSSSEIGILKKSTILSGVIAIITVFMNYNVNSGNRFVLEIGRSMDPNYFSSGFILITAVVIDEIYHKRNRLINIVLLILIFVVIGLTGSRSGLLANIAVIIAYLLLSGKGFIKKASKFILIVLIVGFIIFLFQNFIPIFILNRFSIIEVVNSGGTGRVDIWSNMLKYYSSLSLFSLLFGTGFSTFLKVAVNAYGGDHIAHNIYIQSLLEGGIIGFGITLTTIIIGIKNSLKSGNTYVFAALIGVSVGGLGIDLHISRFFWNILFFSTLTNVNLGKLKFNNTYKWSD